MRSRSPLWVVLVLIVAGTATVRWLSAGAPPVAAERGAPVAPNASRGTPLTVRVTAEGKPVAGASVRVRKADALRVHLIARTDARGLARFEPLDPAAVVVEALAEGFRPSSTEIEGVVVKDGVLALTLQAATAMRGFATHARTNQPLEGVSLLLRTVGHTFDLGLTDERGAFVVPGVESVGESEVVGTAPGFVRQSVRVAEGGTVLLSMQPGLTLSGRVVGPDGAGVPGAEIALQNSFFNAPVFSQRDGQIVVFDSATITSLSEEETFVPAGEKPAPTTDGRLFLDSIDRFEREGLSGAVHSDLDALGGVTDASGAFTLDGIPQFPPLRLRASAPGRLPVDIPLTRMPDGTVSAVRIVLAPAAIVRVRVKRGEGLPVPRDTAARVFHGTDAVSQSVGGERSGEFTFPDVTPGPFAVFAGAAGSRNTVVRGTAKAGDDLRVEVSLEPIGTISGRVLDPEGRPQKGAGVELRFDRHGDPERTAWTDAEGRFEMKDPPAYACDLTAFWPADQRDAWRVFKTPEPQRVRAPAAGLTLRTEPVGGVCFRLVDPKGQPLRETAYALFAGKRVPLWAGVFTRSGLADGEYEVSAIVREWVQHRRTFRIAAGKAVDLGDLEVDAGTTLTGRVLDASGGPLAAAWVGSGVDGEDTLRGRHLAWEAQGTTSTDAAGRFSLAGLPRGRAVRVRVAAAGHATQRFDAVAGGAPLEVRLAPDGVLRGVVLDEVDPEDRDGRLDLTLRRNPETGDDEESIQVVKDAEGVFQFHLNPGTWAAVLTEADGSPIVLGSWRIAPGATVGATLRIPKR